MTVDLYQLLIVLAMLVFVGAMWRLTSGKPGSFTVATLLFFLSIAIFLAAAFVAAQN